MRATSSNQPVGPYEQRVDSVHSEIGLQWSDSALWQLAVNSSAPASCNKDQTEQGVEDNYTIDVLPTQSREKWVDDLADETEVQRLVAMGVLVPAEKFEGEVTGRLATKFVRDTTSMTKGGHSNVGCAVQDM